MLSAVCKMAEKWVTVRPICLLCSLFFTILHSQQTAIMKKKNNNFLDQRSCVDIVFIDLNKAINAVRHNIALCN